MKNDLLRRLRVEPGTRIKLAKCDPDQDWGWDKESARTALDKLRERLAELQYQLYAEGRYAVLVIFQAMDAGGKDGAIRHVFAGVNPQGCRVSSFKAPTALELAHDFLWRIHQAVPGRGEIGIFNRSHYEDVLIARVKNLVPSPVWQARYEQINAFERLLAANGVIIRKFYLHISKQEQRERLAARLDNPAKNWKFNPGDLEDRKLWDQYQLAYQEALNRCSTAVGPWFLIPANKKWFRDLAIAQVLVQTLESLPMQWPKPSFDPKSFKL